MNIKYYQKILTSIAGVMLLLAILEIWPYSFYQVLRWLVCSTAIVNAYDEYNKFGKTVFVFMMAGIAILFNPIAPILLSRGVWIIFDVVAALIMFSFFKAKKWPSF